MSKNEKGKIFTNNGFDLVFDGEYLKWEKMEKEKNIILAN